MLFRCPICRDRMNEHEAKSHYGTNLSIFQCPECLGIWVDGEVVGAISKDSAIEAEADVDFSEISTEPRETAAFCPRCEIYLIEQTGYGPPENLRVDCCTRCNGYWFDKGELMIYKGYMENRRKSFKRSQEENKKRESLIPKMPDQIGKVLRFLNTEMTASFRLPP